MSCRPIHAGHLHKALCVSELQRTERNVHATLDQSTTQDCAGTFPPPEDTDHRWTYPVTTNATLNAKAENNIF